jgi:hypothetical protein
LGAAVLSSFPFLEVLFQAMAAATVTALAAKL